MVFRVIFEKPKHWFFKSKIQPVIQDIGPDIPAENIRFKVKVKFDFILDLFCFKQNKSRIKSNFTFDFGVNKGEFWGPETAFTCSLREKTTSNWEKRSSLSSKPHSIVDTQPRSARKQQVFKMWFDKYPIMVKYEMEYKSVFTF